jgi:hypothetical protein
VEWGKGDYEERFVLCLSVLCLLLSVCESAA